MKRTSILLSAALLLGATALCAKPSQSEENAHGKPPHAKQEKAAKQHGHKFNRAEQETFKSYFDNLPPGLAKKYRRTGNLPAGWEKKVQPGQTMPSDYLKIAQPLPRELLETVGPIDPGTVLLHLNDRILQVHEKTHEILESFMLHNRL